MRLTSILLLLASSSMVVCSSLAINKATTLLPLSSTTTASSTRPPLTQPVVTTRRSSGVITKKHKTSPLHHAAASDAAAAEIPRGGGGTATIPNEVFNLVKSIVGSGVLSLPAGIAAFGNAPSAMIPAVGMIAVMGGVSAYTFALIARICDDTSSTSYSEAWDKTVGTKSSWLIAMSCLVDCFAGNLSYSMILADTFVSLLASLGIVVSRTQSLLGVTGLVLAPLCFMKNLSSLAPFSLVGIMGMLYTTIAMMMRYFGKSYLVPTGKFLESIPHQPAFGNVGASGVLSAKSLILFCMLSNAYIAHFNAPKFYKELKNNTMPRFYQVTAWSFGISVLLYSIISGMGFLTFGSASNGLILNNYSTKDLLMSLSRVAVAISIVFSYPLIFVGTRDSLLDFFKVSNEKRTFSLLNNVTIGILGLVTVLAAKLTDLGLVASLGGATFGTALVFIYPAIMLLQNLKQKGIKNPKESRVAAVIAALGVAMSVTGVTMTLQGVGV